MKKTNEKQRRKSLPLMGKRPVIVRETLSTGREQETGVVVNLKTGKYYPLNKTAHEIWHRINGKRTGLAIVAAIAKRYGAKKSKVADDVERYLVFLGRVGLVRWRS